MAGAVNLRAGAAVIAARVAKLAAQRLARGGGTALPGLVAERLDPDLLAHLAQQVPQGAVVVTGTNGKTTTSHMLAGIVRRAAFEPLRNASGSNLARGITATLAEHAGPLGTLRTNQRTVALLETDEAAFGRVVPAVRPRTVVVTNLFRDQLDRYGEVDTVAAVWHQALERTRHGGELGVPAVPTGAGRSLGPTLVLNADDPTVASLAGPGVFSPDEQDAGTADPASASTGGETAQRGSGSGRALFFGIDDPSLGRPGPEHASDAKVCPVCGARLEYPTCYYSHLGHYTCPNGHRRPTTQVTAGQVQGRGFAGTEFLLTTPAGTTTVRLPLPGIYNVYNALAAVGGALSLGCSVEAIRDGLEEFTGAFGRLERIAVEGRTLYLVLAKNPVGMNEALRTVFADGTPRSLLLALNDLDADGRDISWIWDADFELVVGHINWLVVTGRRAEDLAVRLKYAGVDLADGQAGQAGQARQAEIVPGITAAFDQALSRVPPGESLFAVVTYTAMLELRRLLTERRYVAPYWEGQ